MTVRAHSSQRRLFPTPAATRLVAATAVLGSLLLAGCGAQEALVGLHPAPTERAASAPLDTAGATAVAARVLAAADAPASRDAKAAAKARAAVLGGDALRLADARAAGAGATAPTPATSLGARPKPTILAQSQGRGWPRTILAATLDEATNTESLHVLRSDKPNQPFRIVSSVPMLGGAELPAVGRQGGAPLLDPAAKNGLPAAPADVLKAYAAGTAQPKAKPTNLVAVDDQFATGLRASARIQAQALGKLGTVSQAHEPLLQDAVTLGLADGGAVTFALMRRNDTIKVTPTAKELVLPAEYAKLVGKGKVTSFLALNSLEPVVVVQPKTGKARVIGADELLVSGKGR